MTTPDIARVVLTNPERVRPLLEGAADAHEMFVDDVGPCFIGVGFRYFVGEVPYTGLARIWLAHDAEPVIREISFLVEY